MRPDGDGDGDDDATTEMARLMSEEEDARKGGLPVDADLPPPDRRSMLSRWLDWLGGRSAYPRRRRDGRRQR